jgi:hypothetical protein
VRGIVEQFEPGRIVPHLQADGRGNRPGQRLGGSPRP